MNQLHLSAAAKFQTWLDVVRWRAQEQPQAIAQTFLLNGEQTETNLTYAQLDQNARMIATALQQRTKAGDRALLLYAPGLEFTGAFLGCLLAGVVAVPVYPPRRGQMDKRLLSIAADAQPAIVLTSQSIADALSGNYGEMLQAAGIQLLATDTLTLDLAQSWQKPNITSATLAFLQYTSGSTGTPKGVMVSHGNLLHNAQVIQSKFQTKPQCCSVFWLPEYHDMGLIGGILQPIYVGVRSVRMSPIDFLQKPLRWLQAISRYQASSSGAPNFAYELCVNKITAEQIGELDLSHWALAFSGAEPVRADTLTNFADKFAPCGFRTRAFAPCYGMAEATLMITGVARHQDAERLVVDEHTLTEHVVLTNGDVRNQPRTLVGCGDTHESQSVIIVDPHSLRRSEANQVGEIWLRGESVAQGYWNQPEQSQATFQARLADTGEGPFLRTGDLGFIHEQQVFITGRIKDVIIIRGRNHYPQDIEMSVEKAHVALRAGCGAAFSVDIDNEERLVIAQEVDRHHLHNLNVAEVAAAVRRSVSEQHGLQVAAIIFLRTTAIPKTSSGKIQRYACRKGFLQNTLEMVGEWRAQTM